MAARLASSLSCSMAPPNPPGRLTATMYFLAPRLVQPMKRLKKVCRCPKRGCLIGSDLYVLTLENGKTGELQCLTDSTRSCFSPSWSPNGKTIAFLASPKLASGNHVELFTIDSSGKGGPRNLTSEFEGSCADSTNDDMSNDHILPPPAWSPDGKTLYVLVTHRGATRVFAITSEGAEKHPPTLTQGNVYVRDFSVDLARSKMALLLEDPTHLAEIYVCSTSSPGELRRVTGFNDALLEEVALATPEYMPYTGVED